MRFLWSSDHHTLHQTTPTQHVLSNLSKFLYKDNDLAKTSMIFFGGDFMERMVESPNADNFRIGEWGNDFLDRAYIANPKMTVVWLAGTESHDRGQPKHFLNLAPKGLDVRYIDTLCIETYPQHDNLTVMYVPDNMGKLTPDEIWENALKVLKAHDLDQVDLICLHGGFDFQLHPKARHKGHLLERWETIARYAIFAGHIHIPVQQGKLWTSGSFDRTAHGEEHPKGGYVVELDKAKEYFNPVFWENKNALPYLTIPVTKDITPEQLVVDIHNFIKDRKLPRHSQIRIKGGSALVVNPVVTVLEREYPFFGFKTEPEDNKDELVDDELFNHEAYTGISLVKDNLPEALLPEVDFRFAELSISEEDALSVLQEFL